MKFYGAVIKLFCVNSNITLIMNLNNSLRNSMATTCNEILFNQKPEFQHNKNHQQIKFCNGLNNLHCQIL